MPSTSEKQARFMAAVAHDPKFAKSAGVPQSIGQEFNDADEGSAMLSRAMRRRKMYNHPRSRKAANGDSDNA